MDRYNDLPRYGPDAPDRLEIPVSAFMELIGTGLPVEVGGRLITYDDGPFEVIPDDSMTVEKGGPGSGHHGHRGRPGQRGGSLPGTGGPVGGGDPLAGTDPDYEERMPLVKARLAEFRGKVRRANERYINAWTEAQFESNDALDENSATIKELNKVDDQLNHRRSYLMGVAETNVKNGDAEFYASEYKRLVSDDEEIGRLEAQSKKLVSQSIQLNQKSLDAQQKMADLEEAHRDEFMALYRKEFGINGERGIPAIEQANDPAYKPATAFGLHPGDDQFDAINQRFDKKSDAAIEFYNQILSPKVSFNDELAYVATTVDRAYYVDVTQMAFMGLYDDVDAYVHEYGHHIEHSDYEAHELARSFLLNRRIGKPLMRLLVEFPDRRYTPDEKFWLGAFPEFPYAGKAYAADYTEVLSVGFQNLYKNPYTLMDADPEFFDFIVGIASGVLLEGD